MADEPTGLRAHLLDVEPPDAGRRAQLHREIQAMFDNQLTRKHRALWAIGGVASVLFAAYGAAIASLASMDLPLHLVWWTYAAANVAFAVGAAAVLRAGRFDRRRLGQWLAAVPATALLITVLLVWRAAVAPSVGSLLWVVFGVMCLLVDLAWMLHYRIGQSEWAARESALRLELMLVDLRDQLAARR